MTTTAACTTDVCQSDDKTPVLPYRDGHTNAARTRYETTSWDEPWLTFPSGARYRLEHGLGRQPELSHWISLVDNPFQVGEPATPSAGNETQIWNVTDEYVEISNNTCSDVFLRVVAWVDSPAGETPTASSPKSAP